MKNFIQVHRQIGVFAFRPFGRGRWKVYGLPTFHLRAWRALRSFFPAFYAVGAHCCDHAGQVHAWYPVAFLMERNVRKWRDVGDGPDAFSPISFFEFLKWKWKLHREQRYSDPVDLTWVYEQLEGGD